MKLQCSVLVNSAANVGTHRQYVTSVLLLRNGKDGRIGECELVLTTLRNTKRIFIINRGNVRQIHSTHLHEGCVTIELNRPPVIVYIRNAVPPALQVFMVELHKVLEGCDVTFPRNEKITSNDFAPRKCVIKSMNHYMRRKIGFRNYLRELILSDIGLTAIDNRWFDAISLERLNLGGNHLGRADNFDTKFLNVVRLQNLRVLILDRNEIKSISDDLWNAFPERLEYLDLSGNQISYLSPRCTRFPMMTHLLLGQNRIEELPRKMNELSNLQHIDISCNRLKFLPFEILEMGLDSIDVTDYSGRRESARDMQELLNAQRNIDPKVGSLFEYAAATVLNCRLNTDLLPRHLLPVLLESVEKCEDEGRFTFYPASVVTETFRVLDARSFSYIAVSRNYDYEVVVRYMEKV